ncbi:hypothetical protein ACJX0J_009177, partial [Zea mays]
MNFCLHTFWLREILIASARDILEYFWSFKYFFFVDTMIFLDNPVRREIEGSISGGNKFIKWHARLGPVSMEASFFFRKPICDECESNLQNVFNINSQVSSKEKRTELKNANIRILFYVENQRTTEGTKKILLENKIQDFLDRQVHSIYSEVVSATEISEEITQFVHCQEVTETKNYDIKENSKTDSAFHPFGWLVFWFLQKQMETETEKMPSSNHITHTAAAIKHHINTSAFLLSIRTFTQGKYLYNCIVDVNLHCVLGLAPQEGSLMNLLCELVLYIGYYMVKSHLATFLAPILFVEIINELPEDKTITVYRCGPLVDLCRGPHIPNTSFVKAFACLKASSSYWRGKADRESLQRVYGISFPDSRRLTEYKHFLEEAKKRDHRILGKSQELFFFHELSPGSCFFLPHGARIYNKLMNFMRKQYRDRGYQEVLSPNIYNMQLWETSGHAANYKENMFVFEIEKQEFGLKPMNCPGHCLMFANRVRSYRELPLRMADFGVLHRNELSGALTGLTRVRRFQQDDAHIFCREDQIKDEVKAVLEFINYVYEIFGFKYELELSTRPEKYLGEIETWNKAEQQLTEALNEFGKPWKINEGDGAFYGPKIDIGVFDALKRKFQCATLQLDFQLPIRFKLTYSAEDEAKIERPVMIHRAILGSVERMFAILLEHYNGKWPLWLSPRQAIVCSVSSGSVEYAKQVLAMLHEADFHVDIDVSDRTIQKKVREAQVAQFNYILVVGAQEAETGN